MEENGTYGASGELWGYSWRSLGVSDGGGIAMAVGYVGDSIRG